MYYFKLMNVPLETYLSPLQLMKLLNSMENMNFLKIKELMLWELMGVPSHQPGLSNEPASLWIIGPWIPALLHTRTKHPAGQVKRFLWFYTETLNIYTKSDIFLFCLSACHIQEVWSQYLVLTLLILLWHNKNICCSWTWWCRQHWKTSHIIVICHSANHWRFTTEFG